MNQPVKLLPTTTVFRTLIQKLCILNHKNKELNGVWYLCGEYNTYDTYSTLMYTKEKGKALNIGVVPNEVNDEIIEQIKSDYSISVDLKDADYVEFINENEENIYSTEMIKFIKECYVECKTVVVVRSVIDVELYTKNNKKHGG